MEFPTDGNDSQYCAMPGEVVLYCHQLSGTSLQEVAVRRSRFDPTRLPYPQPEIDFIAALDRVQGEQTDKDFARGIGVSLTLWRKTRNGGKRLSFRLLSAGEDLVSHKIFEAAKAALMERASRRGVKAA